MATATANRIIVGGYFRGGAWVHGHKRVNGSKTFSELKKAQSPAGLVVQLRPPKKKPKTKAKKKTPALRILAAPAPTSQLPKLRFSCEETARCIGARRRA